MSLLTPHKLMRNCSVVLRLLLHLSLLIKAFQAFSISGPGRSSPYWEGRGLKKEHSPCQLRLSQITYASFDKIIFPKHAVTLAVINMRLLRTIDVACKEPQPVPFSGCDEPALVNWLEEL